MRLTITTWQARHADPQEIEFPVDIDGIRSNRLTFERRHWLEQLPQFAETRNYFFKYPLVASLLEDRQPNIWDRLDRNQRSAGEAGAGARRATTLRRQGR